MSNQPSEPQPLFTVTSVEDVQHYGGPGGVEKWKRVNYKVIDGTRSYVEVSPADFNRAKVAQLIEDEVAALGDVMGIAGPPIMPQP